MTIRKIDYPNTGGPSKSGKNPRVETGAVQFGEDWPGYFLRGDDAMLLAMDLQYIISVLEKTDCAALHIERLRLLRSDINKNTILY